MKPMLASVKGTMVSMEASINGYSIEVIDSGGKYTKCFLSNDSINKFSAQFGQLKPNMEVRIKCCKDITIFGEEVLYIEHVYPNKQKEKLHVNV